MTKLITKDTAKDTVRAFALGAALLAGAAGFGGAAWAQFGGPPAPGPMMPGPMVPTGPGGPGGPFGAGTPNPPGAGGNPFGDAKLPFAVGTVASVNAGAGTFVVTSQFGGDARTVRASAQTRITARRDSAVSELRVGDTVQVRGVPTSITASQIGAGDAPDGGPAPGGMMGGPMMGGPGSMAPGGMMGGGPFGAGRPGPASAQATGKVTGLTPLTITLPGGVSVTLTAAPNVKVTRTVSVPLSALKVGDRVTANGKPNNGGDLIATRVRVNDPDAAGGMFGGY